uniref:Uncharacterized protein n=1 Tax=Tanacetum cinerariifolium TaxID=118510 RepID=A0A699QCF7_TANCI|nr:hypothetical protein [Tanacetum cinerariifolium]
MDALLSPDHVFDFFVAEPVPGLAKAPNNQNGWIEWDVPLGGEMDEPMENPGFDKEEELDEFMDDDKDVLDKDEEWLMASMTPPRATVTVSRAYEVGGPSTATSVGHTLTTMASVVATQPQMIDNLCVRLSNLEYRHGELVKKMVKVSDAKAVPVVSRLEEIETRVQHVESRVDTYLSGQMAVPGQDVIVRLSYQVQTLQTTLHGAELQNQQLRTRVVEMESREGILMSHMLWMEECLTVLEKRLSGPPSGTQ